MKCNDILLEKCKALSLVFIWRKTFSHSQNLEATERVICTLLVPYCMYLQNSLVFLKTTLGVCLISDMEVSSSIWPAYSKQFFFFARLGLGLGPFESKYNDVAESRLSASQHSIKRMRSSFSAQSFSFCIFPHLSQILSSLLRKTR